MTRSAEVARRWTMGKELARDVARQPATFTGRDGDVRELHQDRGAGADCYTPGRGPLPTVNQHEVST